MNMMKWFVNSVNHGNRHRHIGCSSLNRLLIIIMNVESKFAGKLMITSLKGVEPTKEVQLDMAHSGIAM